jgi:DNA-binding transcriptional regulator YdaS (Cro superfamily)
MNALEQAIQAVGGVTALASHVGVAPSAPSMWKQRGRVPAEHCPLIERATGGAVRCEDLRPDVAWDVLRMQADQACAEAGREVADA